MLPPILYTGIYCTVRHIRVQANVLSLMCDFLLVRILSILYHHFTSEMKGILNELIVLHLKCQIQFSSGTVRERLL